MERQIYTQRNRFTHREIDIHTYENLRCQNRCGKLSFKSRRSPPPPDHIIVLIRTDLLMLHKISRLNAPTSVDYEWWRKAYKMNTKSERGSE